MLHLRKCWIPLQEVGLQENPEQEQIHLFLDDLFGTGGTEMEQRVLARLRKNFQVGSEDWNDVKTKNSLDERSSIRTVH